MINQSLNIDIASELSRFDIHLNNNPRTIFSAKFGVENHLFFCVKYHRYLHNWNIFTNFAAINIYI